MTTDPPAQPVQIRIAEAYRDLPEAMRRIADSLMSDPLLGALWGIEIMSERAEVSVGTVVRFAKRLGYKGFSEFRDALRAACHARSGDAELELMEIPSHDVIGTLAEVTRRDGENRGGRDERRRVSRRLPQRLRGGCRPKTVNVLQQVAGGLVQRAPAGCFV